MPQEFEYDVFLSHSSKDKDVVRGVAERLRAAGLKIFFDEWSIKVGDHIFLSIEKGLDSSRVLVLFLSSAAVDSQWVDLERGVALFRDPRNSGRRFVPVLLEDCELPGTLSAYKYVDFRKKSDEAFTALLEACQAGAGIAETGVPTPGAPPEIESRCHELRDKAETLLVAKEALRLALATEVKKQLGQPSGALDASDTSELLKVICSQLKTFQLLRIFLELSRKRGSEGSLESLLGLLLPVVYWNELDRYRSKISREWMRLPIVEAAYAEIVQAAFDGRKLELFCTPEAALRSELAVDAPLPPEATVSEQLKGEELIAHLHNVLVGKNLYKDRLLSAHHFAVTAKMAPATQTAQRAKIINNFLGREQQENNRVYFLLIDKPTYCAYGQEANVFLESFRKLLPSLRIVVLEGEWDQFADEAIVLEDLVRFYSPVKPTG